MERSLKKKMYFFIKTGHTLSHYSDSATFKLLKMHLATIYSFLLYTSHCIVVYKYVEMIKSRNI